MPKFNRYKIHFAYTQFVRGQKIIRGKTHIYEAPDGNAAIEKVQRVYGKIKVFKCERQ